MNSAHLFYHQCYTWIDGINTLCSSMRTASQIPVSHAGRVRPDGPNWLQFSGQKCHCIQYNATKPKRSQVTREHSVLTRVFRCHAPETKTQSLYLPARHRPRINGTKPSQKCKSAHIRAYVWFTLSGWASLVWSGLVWSGLGLALALALAEAHSKVCFNPLRCF
jgi:hypothetical protein